LCFSTCGCMDIQAQHPPSHYLRLLRRHNPRIDRRETSAVAKDAIQGGFRAVTGRLLDIVKEGTKVPAECLPPRPHTAQPRLAATEISSPVQNGLGDPCSPGPGAAAAGFVELAATEQCPHCSRRFSREAAARHVPICAGLRNRPKPPIKEQVTYFTDPLGRRHASGSNTALINMNTPTRSSRKPCARPATAPAMGADLNPVEDEGGKGVLRRQWDLVQFLLRDGLEALADDAAITKTMKQAGECLEFLKNMEEYASRLGMRKGALSRMLLPFDLETNSKDQASTALEAPLGSHELNGLVSNSERKELVAKAVLLRRLVRVKVADCADVEQAQESLRLTSSFLHELKRLAAEEQRSMTSILREL